VPVGPIQGGAPPLLDFRPSPPLLPQPAPTPRPSPLGLAPSIPPAGGPIPITPVVPQ
jgi:hypothetical protein